MHKKKYKNNLPEWFITRMLNFYHKMRKEDETDTDIHEKNLTCIYCGKKATTMNVRSENTCEEHKRLADSERIDKILGDTNRPAKSKKLDDVQKAVLKDVREMTDFIEKYSTRKGGIQPNKYIDRIKFYIEHTILVPAEINLARKKKRKL